MRQGAVALALLLFSSLAGAAELPAAAVVVVKTGALAAELQARHLWNLQKLVFRANVVATPTGAFGTVISVPAAGGWVGSAHTQGGVEQIEQVELTVDGQPAELSDGRSYSGERIVLRKSSRLDRVHLEAEYIFANGRITERVRLTPTEDVVVTSVYPFMHCISAEATEWMAITEDNREEAGQFSASRKLQWHEGWAWTAAYIPQSRTGFLLRILRRPEGLTVRTGYWDQDRYRKLYVSTPLDEQVWRAGRSLEAEVVLTCFEAEPEAWKVTACQVAAGLIAQ